MKYHTRNLEKLKGMLQVIPGTSLFLLVAALALVGLPPLNIFISKFTIIAAGFQTGHVWLMIFILLSLAVIFAAVMKVISTIALREIPEGMVKGEVKPWGLIPLAVLVVFIFLLGVYIPPQLDTLLTQATNIVMTGQSAIASPEALINLTKILIP